MFEGLMLFISFDFGWLVEKTACIASFESTRMSTFENAWGLYRSCCKAREIASIWTSKFDLFTRTVAYCEKSLQCTPYSVVCLLGLPENHQCRLWASPSQDNEGLSFLLQLILRPVGMYLKQYNKNSFNFSVMTFHVLHVVDIVPVEDQNMFSHIKKMILAVMLLNNILHFGIYNSHFCFCLWHKSAWWLSHYHIYSSVSDTKCKPTLDFTYTKKM
jgi:hypothetical protein